MRTQHVQGVVGHSLTASNPWCNSLVYFFSKLGIYQKAFEHLGNALTYDPTNYKVLQTIKPQSLYSDAPSAAKGDLALESILDT